MVTTRDAVALLMQGVDYGDEQIKQTMTAELQERLLLAEKEHRPLRVYCGYDPTKADLHLGHTVTMRKLKQFQDLGHDVTFLIGDYTALIGDPSDKDVTRPMLKNKEIEENGRTYAEQAFRILDSEKTHVRYNSEWLSKLTFEQVIKLASNFTVQQFLSREKFKLRWDKGDPVFLHETLYAVMQGYDAYMLKADVQVGGTDQFFNIVTAARKIMTAFGALPNIGICLGLLPGTDGELKMSKSLGNHIPINTDANDIYGKIMSIPDSAMPPYFRLVTRWSPVEVEKLEKNIASGEIHPRDAKMKLAWEVAASFYGNTKADDAQKDFVLRFQHGELPDEIQQYEIRSESTWLDVLIGCGFVSSRGEGRRLFEQNGVRLDHQVISEWSALAQPGVLQIGKRRFIRLVKVETE